MAHPFHAALEALEAYPYPVVARSTATRSAAGWSWPLPADIRLAARGVKLGMPPAKLGLIYSHTGLLKFIEVCGPADTAELFYVGRNVDAGAPSIGLVNDVVEPESWTSACSSWRRRSPRTRRSRCAGNKRMLRALRAPRCPRIEHELVELRESCFRSEDFREGVRAFGEKRRRSGSNR